MKDCREADRHRRGPRGSLAGSASSERLLNQRHADFSPGATLDPAVIIVGYGTDRTCVTTVSLRVPTATNGRPVVVTDGPAASAAGQGANAALTSETMTPPSSTRARA